jgi:hypothetical protein
MPFESFAVPIPTHTEAGVAELMKINVWRRSHTGELIHEITQYAIGISRFDSAVPLDATDFKKVLDEAQQARLSEASPRDGGQ